MSHTALINKGWPGLLRQELVTYEMYSGTVSKKTVPEYLIKMVDTMTVIMSLLFIKKVLHGLVHYRTLCYLIRVI